MIRELTCAVDTATSSDLFNEYARQSYLDNLLRGGYPHIIDNKEDGFIYHLFSRKHGDLERDYNFFTIAPEYYSQGNGNFRDANQNRRNDIFFNPKVKTFNMKMFFSFIQADGYNPLSVKGCSFELKEKEQVKTLLEKHFGGFNQNLADLLSGKFTPGGIHQIISGRNLQYLTSEEAFFADVFALSKQNYEASFGEGYWVDHWTYNMDLIDSYLDIYPDMLKEAFFEDKEYMFFDSPAFVQPRNEKYVLSKGKVRQYGSVIEDHEKMTQQGTNMNETNWLKTKRGQGEIYTTNLFTKLLSLSVNKFATLDPAGIGIEMEADKPGWNDALNGLPGLLGSGISETFELKRVVLFIQSIIDSHEDVKVDLPIEIAEYLQEINTAVEKNLCGEITDYQYWDEASTLREAYREKIRFGIVGEENTFELKDFKKVIALMLQKLNRGISKAEELGKGLTPTYLTFDAEEFEVVTDKEGKEILSHYGLPKVKINRLSEPKPLAYFLEGPTRAFKTFDNQDIAKKTHEAVKQTDLFDAQLKMYKTSVSLNEESFEIGRIKAFTPGWLERESVFLHMSYKYLLSLLKTGLHAEFFEEIKTSLIPFLDPNVYGRSVLENSSFIASSNNPDSLTHGKGFVARLSGSTAEFLSMWKLMLAGDKVFQMKDGNLTMALKPALPNWLFTAEGTVSFSFLGSTKVVYKNANKKDTFGSNKAEVSSYQLVYYDGRKKEVEGSMLLEKEAKEVRNGEVAEIHCTLI
ncbi:hypothetical protein LC087_07400 [Bacillus carboniphilus]|uniref:Cellobiose phosphorylase n=1 Tax=Bacillus carboniphilus TaxID=86663 RepID=A0ABY9JYS6_9BACI|nr:hypothetical protein [Bacillus carboniphilus]WLR43928.1 hypothetical protein LC087_07400 [Bacillus carboniphilus]